MKTISILLLLFLQATAFSAERQHVSFSPDSPQWKWLPVTLTEAERELLAKRSDSPKTALDYYLLLSGGYFKNIRHEEKRRITFIDQETLSDQYLHAEYTIPATDAGSFSITIRIFHGGAKPLIAISHLSGGKRIFMAKENGPQGLWSIVMNRPQFWHYHGGAFSDGGALMRAPDSIMPELSVDRVLDRYRNHYKGHLKDPTQKKSIYLKYELPPKGNSVSVKGRENFMSSQQIWAEFTYDGNRFVPSTDRGQAGAGQPAPESKTEGEE